MSRWTKHIFRFFWLRSGNGIFDLIFNTLTKIIMDNDTSDWAVCAFMECAQSLIDRERYPEEMKREGTAATRYGYFIRKRILKQEPVYKPRTLMTRDPFIALGACYQHLLGSVDTERYIALTIIFKQVTIPFYLYRYETFNWFRNLKQDDREFYVKRLGYLKGFAELTKFERKHVLWPNN